MTPTIDSRTDPRRTPRSPVADELASRIAHRIAGRAGGRIRDLRVECTEDTIILQGRSRTQHDKQIAHEAVLDIAGDRSLSNRIQVGR